MSDELSAVQEQPIVLPAHRNMAGQWRPGQSGNPEGGRLRKKPITEALEKVFTPDECMKAAKALAKKVRAGSIAHFQEATNRLEGRVSDSEESRGTNIRIIVDIPD